MKGKKILLGVCGSIAAYKALLLVRLLVKEGAEVKVILTPSVKDFVGPLSFSTLSKNPVLTDLFDEESWANHVMLGRWADLMIIAPLSCNTLSKMANGACDNLLMAVYLSATCPVMVAPAMDEDMWHHESTRQNLHTIQSNGNIVLPVEKGELASGLNGEGRMAEPEQIVQIIHQHFTDKQRLRGKKVLVTAGPTYEALDPVRFIGNHSSGKMGIAIVNELIKEGAEVLLIAGPVSVALPDGCEIIRVVSASQMYDACVKNAGIQDIIIMSAAVADYTPASVSPEKIKKKEQSLSLELIKTKDILKTLGESKTENQLLVGFALETNNERENAIEKLKLKNADIIVLNSLRDEAAGFGHDTNKISIFDNKGGEEEFDIKTKTDAARDIINKIIRTINE